MSAPAILLALLLGAAMLVTPRVGAFALWSRLRIRRERARAEDALKHVLACKHRDQLASLESLAGTLRLSPGAALRLAARLQSAGWIEVGSSGIALTPGGERRALQVVRAHRLWERHLSDDANMPMDRLHHAAERAEHTLTNEQVAKLDAHLGHPQHDPHGDPIPRADGHVTPLKASGLNEWPAQLPARIVHVEDEPHAVFRHILSSGLRPSLIVRIIRREPDAIVVEAAGRRCRIDPAVAASIQVGPASEGDLLPPEAIRLSELAQGESAQVIELGPGCQGFSRRRMLDLGLTPGASVQAALDNTFGDPRAFRVRGTTIAMRREQTDQVWIRRATAEPSREEMS